MNVRIGNAITAVCDAIATAADIPADSVGVDDDIITDLDLTWFELESLTLILEEIFNVTVPSDHWERPHWRTPSSLAEWLIARSDEAAWATAKERKRA